MSGDQRVSGVSGSSQIQKSESTTSASMLKRSGSTSKVSTVSEPSKLDTKVNTVATKSLEALASDAKKIETGTVKPKRFETFKTNCGIAWQNTGTFFVKNAKAFANLFKIAYKTKGSTIMAGPKTYNPIRKAQFHFVQKAFTKHMEKEFCTENLVGQKKALEVLDILKDPSKSNPEKLQAAQELRNMCDRSIGIPELGVELNVDAVDVRKLGESIQAGDLKKVEHYVKNILKAVESNINDSFYRFKNTDSYDVKANIEEILPEYKPFV